MKYDEARFEQAVQHLIAFCFYLAEKNCPGGEPPAAILTEALQRVQRITPPPAEDAQQVQLA